ncbi:MAG: sensor histidine kinase [Desulfuromonas sp.]|nr:sensor histidine kinase [Desulfuromonas sp.]
MWNRGQHRFTKFYPKSLQGQMLILVSLVVLLQLIISGAIFTTFISKISQQQIGKRALDIAHTVAAIPLVVEALHDARLQPQVQQLVETVRDKTGVEFIVVADRHSRRLSHPSSEEIGQKFIGGDEFAALNYGRSYLSQATGTLGPSLRSIVPIYADDEQIVGFVAVGYLQQKIAQTVYGYQQEPATLVFMLLVVAILGSSAVAHYVKRQTLGLEPREISSLFLERQAILESIRAGIIAVDGQGAIRLINQAAIEHFQLESQQMIVGKNITEVFAGSEVLPLLQPGSEQSFREISVDGHDLLFNSVPIVNRASDNGLVASFRRMDDLTRLQLELRQSQEFTEMLRVQAHEYSNKLHMLAGFLQIKAYDEALELVSNEASGLQSLIHFLSTTVPHSSLAAIIMGKSNRANELKVEFLLDPDSSMVDIPTGYNFDKLVTIVGNLIDNALEAAVAYSARPPSVKLFMTDMGHDLIFEIEDSGAGVPVALQEIIFQQGYTSKAAQHDLYHAHGVGLYVVSNYVQQLAGDLTISTGDLGGALFTLSLPKQPQRKEQS